MPQPYLLQAFALVSAACFGVFATQVSAEGALAPLPGQTLTPPLPVETPQAAPQTEALPGLAPLPVSPDASGSISHALRAERDTLHQKFLELKARLARISSADDPVKPETNTQLEDAAQRLQKAEQAVMLEQWKSNSAATLLQTINGRPLGAVQSLPPETVIAPGFATMRLASSAYDRPSSTNGTVLYAIAQATPILELATSSDGGWSFAWIPGGGYGYVLKSQISQLGGAQ